jgi:hypothetical protein
MEKQARGIYFPVQGGTNTSVSANSIQKAAELLGVPVSKVEDSGCLVPCGPFDGSEVNASVCELRVKGLEAETYSGTTTAVADSAVNSDGGERPAGEEK